MPPRFGEWGSAAGLLAGMVETPEAPRHLRELYVVALGHLGRHEEVLRQLARLEPQPRETRAGREAEPPDAPPDRTLEVVLTAAWALRDVGRDAEAEATFRRVLALDPENQEARLALLHLYGTAEERAAHAAAVAARQQSETDPVALFEEGSDLLGALELEAGRRDAHAFLALAYTELGDEAAAARHRELAGRAGG